jgi:hypothetical protein
MTDFDTARDLHSRVSSTHTQWMSANVLEQDGVRGKIASMLAFHIQDGATEHIDVNISGTDSTDDSVQIAVFTATEVLLIVVAGEQAVTSKMIARSTLRSVTLHNVPNLMLGGYGDGSQLRVGLEYDSMPDGETVELGHAGQTARNASELQAFLRSLRADLTSRATATA